MLPSVSPKPTQGSLQCFSLSTICVCVCVISVMLLCYVLLRRGHLGGALGGALVAWALGPRLVRGADGRFYDSPPLPWRAYEAPAKRVGSARAAAPARAPATPPAIEGASGGRRAPPRGSAAVSAPASAATSDVSLALPSQETGVATVDMTSEPRGRGWSLLWWRRPQLQGAASQ